MKKKPLHFQGKDALAHLIDARKRGKAATVETHGTEMPGHLFAATDAAKETALLALVLFPFLHLFHESSFLIFFFFGWLIWKTGRSALLGWERLERLHRLIEQERWEIEHHRSQEKQELETMYRAKGFSGKLLEEAVQVLMADDNRLLQLMLEEELGLSLETYEHPLKQGFGAFIGVFLSFSLLFIGWHFPFGVYLAGALIIALSAIVAAKQQKNIWISSLVWNLSLAALVCGSIYFCLKIFQ